MKGSVEDRPILFTADTGATRSVIPSRVYSEINPRIRPQLTHSKSLVSADGAPIKELGRGIFNVKLGPVHMCKEVIVAEIEDEGLLGMDILQNDPCGPADILMSQGIIKLCQQEVPCIGTGRNNRNRQVTIASDSTIPAHSETLVDVFVERFERDELCGLTEFVIEPTAGFKNTYPSEMAAALIDNSKNVTSKIRLLNPFAEPFLLKQNAVVGVAEPVTEQPIILVKQENEATEGSNASIRRLELQGCIKNSLEDNCATRKQIEPRVFPEHLRSLFNESIKNIQPQGQAAIADLLTRYQDVFSKDEWDIGCTHLTEHSIDTKGAAPIKQPPRRVPMAYAEEEKKAIEKLLEQKVARKSTSPWASPIVLVKKKNGSIRPCVDYRKLNSLVTPDAFPLPRIQDCLDAVSGATLFSTFDLTSGYFQIPVKEEDIPKTAFCCKYGQFEMTRLPFGLNNSASTFQRTMELALQGLQWETCIIYIDDIIVFAENLEEHIRRIEQVFERLRQAGLKLKPEKCFMMQTEVTFLSHVVSAKGVRPNPINTSKILEWPVPKTTRQVKQFVAMCSYFRRFVKDFAKKGRQFTWTPACQESFESLKTALVSPSVMGYPLNDSGEFILDVDASDCAVGGVLLQTSQRDSKSKRSPFYF